MKIVVATPHNGETKAMFTWSLGRLLIYAGRLGVPGPVGNVPVELDLLMVGSSDLVANRQNMADVADESGADFILWLDSDQVFPPHALERLMSLKQLVVGCNYARRSRPTGPTATIMKDGKREPVWTTQKLATEHAVQRVHGLGLGVCLMAMSALRSVERPWFQWGPAGEDGYLFDKLAAAGVPVFLDHALSWQVGHLGLQTVTNADTAADKADWLKQRATTIATGRRPLTPGYR